MPSIVSSPRPPARHRRRGVAIVATVAIVLQLCALYWPVVSIEGPVSWTDKVVHVLVFAVPTYLLGWALHRVGAAVAVFMVHAPVSELTQHFFLPGRSGDVWDAVVDLVGVTLAAAMLMVRARRERW